MANIFATENSVFFIGGTGTKAGATYNGGCTKEFFANNGGEGGFDLSTIMGANGAAKVGLSGCHYDHEGAAEGDRKVYKNNAGEFADAQVGMVAYISGTNITLSRYKITGVDSANGNYVLVAGIVATGDNDDTGIYIGGALNSLPYALGSGILDATAFNVYVYDNKAETLSAGIDVSVEGSSSAGTHLYVKGFNTVPGDMDYGGNYYQSPLSADNDGIDTSKCVEIDGDGGDYHLLDLTDMEGIHLQNFYFHNVTTDTSKALAYKGYYIGFHNCRFNQAGYGAMNVYFAAYVGCWFGSNFDSTCVMSYGISVLMDSFINSPAGHYGVRVVTGGFIIRNIFVGGIYAIDTYYSTFTCCAWNTFYNQTEGCIRCCDDAAFIEFGNVFVPADENDYAVLATHTTNGCGVVLYSDFSLAYNVAGNDFAHPPWYDNYNDRDLQGANSLKDVDPQFIDAANGDFRPRSPDVIRRGKPDIHGNSTSMGAVLEPADTVIRAAMANLGRLKIFR